MSFIDTVKKNIAYQSADQVIEICTPLFKNFPISYFSYTRVYKDDSVLTLITHRDWLYHYIKNYQLMFCTKKIVTWESNMPQQAKRDAAMHQNIYNGIILGNTTQHYIEEIEFASPNQDHSPLEFCFQHKDLLNQFIFYFKDKAKELIKKADKDRLYFTKQMFAHKNYCEKSYAEFQAALKTNKLRMNFNVDEIAFSKREFETLSLIAQGHTIKHVAAILHLSPRTVETHVNNAKNKTRDFSTAQMIEKFKENLF